MAVQRHLRGDVLAPRLQGGEVVADHGLARWEELARATGQSGEGFIAATDRRLVYVSDVGMNFTSFMYESLATHSVRRKLLTAQLRVALKDGQQATFTGGKGAYDAMSDLIVKGTMAAVPLETTTVDVRPDARRCRGCSTHVAAVRYTWCPACGRRIDWAASSS